MKKTRLSGVKVLAILLFAVSLFAMFTLTACNNNQLDVAELTVVEDTVPGVVTVGSADLSGLRLNVIDSEGKSVDISYTPSMLTSEGKKALETVGQQEVTIFYGGKTVILTVLVVEEGTETVTVAFLDAQNKSLGKRTVVKGTGITNAPNAPDADGNKVFVGWYDTNGKKFDLNKVESDATVVATYAENATEFEVKFLDYKGQQVGQTQMVRYGGYATAPTYSMPYEITSFSWQGLNNPITSNTTFQMSVQMRSYQVLYYYVFESKKEVKYTINDNKGPVVESVEAGKNATKRQTAQSLLASQNLEFVEWQNTSTVINAQTEMIAIVKDRNFTITYSYDNKIDSYTYLSGTGITPKTTAPQKTGYVFNGEWQGNDGQVYSKTFIVQKDLVLTPIYNKCSTPIKIYFTFTGMKESPMGGDDSYVTEDMEEDRIFFGDKVDLSYINTKLAELKNKNKGKYDGYEIESISYEDEENDVTDKGVTLGEKEGGEYHEFYVVLVDSSMPTYGLEFQYYPELNGYQVTGYTGSSKNIYIPETYNDKTNGTLPVVRIGDSAFSYVEIITIKFPQSLKEIGDRAFRNATFHNDIVIPAVTSFGKDVFAFAKTASYVATGEDDQEYLVYKKIKVTFTNGEGTIKALDGNTFNCSKGIVEVVLPSTVVEITERTPETAMQDRIADEIEKINLDNVEILGDQVFWYSVSLKEVGSLAKLKKVGSRAFFGTAISQIDLPNVKEIGVSAFDSMPNLTSLSIATATVYEESEEKISFDMSELCFTAITEIVFGQGVEKVIFNSGKLSSLKKVDFGKNVTEIIFKASLAPYLSVVTVASGNEKYYAQDNVLFEKVENGYVLMMYPCNKLGDYVIPETVNSAEMVGVSTDFARAKINAITFNKKSIDYLLESEDFVAGTTVAGAIFDFGTVEDYDVDTIVARLNDLMAKIPATMYYINIDQDVKEIIEKGNFSNLYQYDAKEGTTVKYDASYKLVYSVADGKATVLSTDRASATIIIPATLGKYAVTAIDKDAFVNNSNVKTIQIDAVLNSMGNLTGCTSLEKIVFKGWSVDADTSVEGYADTVIGKNNNVFVLGGVLVDYNENAELKNPLVITASSLEGVREIPEGFFSGSIFTEITLPDSVKYIRKGAFKNCADLESVEFNAVIQIDDEAFMGCVALEKAVLTEVIGLGASVFEGCTSLKSVYIPKKINNGLIPVRAFYNCSSLTSVSMPLVTAFSERNGSSQAFYGCRALEDISFVNRFAKISTSAFNNCTSIKKVDFTEMSTTAIGSYAFGGCTGIEYIVFSSNITSIGTSAFYCDDSALVSIEFKGNGGLLALSTPIAENVFPSQGYVIYVSGGASQAALSNYTAKGIQVRTTTPTITFGMYEGFGANGQLNMSSINDTLYISVAPEAPDFSGYVFSGWYLKNDESGFYTRVPFPYNVTEDVTFYAKYYNINKGSFVDADMEMYEVDGVKGWRLKGFNLLASDTNLDEVFIPAEYTDNTGKTYPVIAIDMKFADGWTTGKTIEIPEGVIEIKYSGNFVDNALEKIVIPSTVKYIYNNAFKTSKNVEEFVFAEGIDAEKIASNAFSDTNWWLARVQEAESGLNNGFVMAGNVAMAYYGNSKYVEIPSDVTVLNDELFKANETITEVKFNAKLHTIGNNCFEDAISLKYISYPNGDNSKSVIAKIGTGAFDGTPWLAAQDMVIVGTILMQYKGLSYETVLNIPDYITEISSNAFENCIAKSIVFGSSSKLQKIGDYAFKKSSLESITLPAVTEMGEGLFENCVSLKTADLSKVSVKVLPNNTFKGNSSLLTVVLSQNIEELGNNAFAGCTKLSSLTADGVVVYETIEESGIFDSAFYNVTATDEDQFIVVGKILIKYIMAKNDSGDKADEDKITTIPDGIETIFNKVFYYNTSINIVNIPASVITIGDSAFFGCVDLKEVVFVGEGLQNIGVSAFYGCLKLESFDFPDTLQTIGASAFYESGLKEVVLGDSVSTIDQDAFGRIENLSTVTIGNGITFIGENAFAENENLYKVNWNWITETVLSDDNKEYNSFDLLVKNIREELDDNSTQFVNYIKGLFSKSAGYDIRIYFNETSYNYVNNSEDDFINAWAKPENGIHIYREGVYPTVSFNHEGDTDYFMNSFEAEVIESIGIPAMTGHTFVMWTIDGKELVLPYRVYNDITLTPVWFANEVNADDSNNKVYFTESTDNNGNVNGYIINGLKEAITELYIPSVINNAKPVIGINLTATESNVEFASAVKKIVITNAGAFDYLSGAFKFFPNLEEITLLTVNSTPIDVFVSDGVLYADGGKTIVAYLARYEEVEQNGVTVKKKLTEFVVPDQVDTILSYAFVNSGLTKITLGKGVTTIDDYAFNNEVREIAFATGINITSAKKEAFENTAWYVKGSAEEYVVNGSTVGLFYTAGNMLYEYKYISRVDSLVIPDVIRGFEITVIASEINRGEKISVDYLVLPAKLYKINKNAFNIIVNGDEANPVNNVDITKDVTVKGTVLSDIAEEVFEDTTFYKSYNDMLILGSVLIKCQNMNSDIKVPEGVVSISSKAFDGNISVRTITLPSTLRYIGSQAFYGCVNLQAIDIPANVVEIGNSAFTSCTKLASVTFAQANSKLVKIGEGAFSSCSSLSSISIPYTVESIGQEAFINCTSLTTVQFDYIVVSTDSNNNIITTVQAKSKLTVLGQKAFYNCVGLTSVSVPNGIQTIEQSTFQNCRELATVVFDVNLSELRVIGEKAFEGCSKLGGTVDLANPSLITLVLPNKLKTIKAEAFKNCSMLLGVTLSYNVAEIESNVFAGCLRLAKLEVLRSNPAQIKDDSFRRESDDGTKPYYNLRIYVKNSTGETTLTEYKKASGWIQYKTCIFERTDLPGLVYTKTINSGTSSNTLESEVMKAEIIIDPTYYWENLEHNTWRYSIFKTRIYNEEGFSDLTKGLVSFEDTYRKSDNRIEDFSYQRQTDSQGNEHIILIVDCDEMTLLYAPKN